jgi:hypothetical protein
VALELSEPEAALVEATQQGKPLVCTSGVADLRAEVIQLLCLNRRSDWSAPRGVRVKGFRILGELDFEYGQLASQLVLDSCEVKAGINLRFARARVLDFTGCELGPFAAARVLLTDNLILKAARINGQLELRQAVIEGQLDADGLVVLPTQDQPAIRADGIKVGGDIFLRGARLRGQARFPGADIRGNVEFDGATLENPGSSALTLEQADIGGSLFLRRSTGVSPQADFHSLGEVTLLSVNVGDEISCAGALMENPGRRALVCDRARVAGSVFFTEGLRARGEVRLAGIRIESNLEVSDAVLENPEGYALFAVDVEIKGVLILFNLPARPRGRINLEHASVRALLDDTGSWPDAGCLEINGFRYAELGFRRPLDWSTCLTWLRLQPRRPFRVQPYEQLAQVIRSMGRTSDSKVVLAERQNDLRRHGGLQRRDRVSNWMLSVTVGHGYFPGRIWWWVLGSIGIAWGVYALFYWHGTLVPEFGEGPEALWLQLLLLAVGKLLPIVNIERESIWWIDPLSVGGGTNRVHR